MAGNTLQITPFMHVANVAAAVGDFEKLGFAAIVHDSRYAYVEREGAGIRIQWHDDPAELNTGHGGFASYIDVRDLAVVEQQLAAVVPSFPQGDVHGPVDQAYGQRELMIRHQAAIWWCSGKRSDE